MGSKGIRWTVGSTKVEVRKTGLQGTVVAFRGNYDKIQIRLNNGTVQWFSRKELRNLS